MPGRNHHEGWAGYFQLLKSPLFILKKMQRDVLRKHSPIICGRLLDVGCGPSPYRKYFPHAEYIGMDSAKKATVSLQGDALNLPFQDASIDGALLTEVIEHVPAPEALIQGVARVLKKDGLLYMTAPMTWCLHYEPNDYYRFTRYGLDFLLQNNGLAAVKFVRIGGFCSMISVRFMDVFFETIQKLLFFLTPRWREKIGLLVLLPFSISFYYLSLLLDQIDSRDALGWAVLARKTE